jgi:outer membrane autotransporter protein
VNLSRGARWYLTYDGVDPTVNAPGQLLGTKPDGNFGDGQVTGLIASVDPEALPFSSSEVQAAEAGEALHTVLFDRMRAGGNSFWITEYTGFITRKETNADSRGIVAGVDKAVGPLKRLGFFAGYNWGHSENNDDYWDVDSKGYTLGIYTEARFDKFTPAFVMSYGKTNLKYKQKVIGAGEVDSDSESWYIFPEFSLGYETEKIGTFSLQPALHIGYIYLKMDEYEDNAGLKVDDRTIGLLTTRGELNFITENKKGNIRFMPRVGIATRKRINGDNKVDMWVADKKFEDVSLKNDAEETFGYLGGNLRFSLIGNVKFYSDTEISFGENNRRGLHTSLGIIIPLQ